MDLLPEIIHTENTPIPVPEMTMAQCQEDTSKRMDFYNRLKTEIRSHLVINSQLFLLCSDRDSYGGGREPRNYMERPSGGSYRDSYDGYGKILTP